MIEYIYNHFDNYSLTWPWAGGDLDWDVNGSGKYRLTSETLDLHTNTLKRTFG